MKDKFCVQMCQRDLFLAVSANNNIWGIYIGAEDLLVLSVIDKSEKCA